MLAFEFNSTKIKMNSYIYNHILNTRHPSKEALATVLDVLLGEIDLAPGILSLADGHLHHSGACQAHDTSQPTRLRGHFQVTH